MQIQQFNRSVYSSCWWSWIVLLLYQHVGPRCRIVQFIIRQNGGELCRAESNSNLSGHPTDDQMASCGAVTLAEEGKNLPIVSVRKPH